MAQAEVDGFYVSFFFFALRSETSCVRLLSEFSSIPHMTCFEQEYAVFGKGCGWIDPLSKAIGLLCFSCSVRWQKTFVIGPAQRSSIEFDD